MKLKPSRFFPGKTERTNALQACKKLTAHQQKTEAKTTKIKKL